MLARAAADGEDQDRVLPLSREASSQAAKAVSQPSSLVRAVSSETLSVGA